MVDTVPVPIPTVKGKMLGLMNLPELLGLRSEMQVHYCTVYSPQCTLYTVYYTLWTMDYGLYTGDEKDRRPGGRLACHSTGSTGGCPLLGQVRQSSTVLYCPLLSFSTVLHCPLLSLLSSTVI